MGITIRTKIRSTVGEMYPYGARLLTAKGRFLSCAGGVEGSASRVAASGRTARSMCVGSNKFSLDRGPRRRTSAAPTEVKASNHRRPGLLCLIEGLVHGLLAGERELELLIEGTHQLFGL